MMYRHWTLCVLFSIVLVVLSAIFVGLGYNTATAICAIILGALITRFGFALLALRRELKREIRKYAKAVSATTQTRQEYMALLAQLEAIERRGHTREPTSRTRDPNGTALN
jgi:nitrate reductase gamma subunit